jgi:hypothetical protein
MKNEMSLDGYGVIELDEIVSKSTEGGDAISDAWDLTPANGSSSFINMGSGVFAGYIEAPCGSGTGGFNTTAGISWYKGPCF